jgi:hypothetical protein
LQGTSGSSDEVILAEEEAVINRGIGIVQEVKSDLDVGSQTEGNLVLTNRRLFYAHGASREVKVPSSATAPFDVLGRKRLVVSDISDLDSIPSDPSNIQIRLSSMVSVKGHHTPGFAPKLEVRWNDSGTVKVTEFVEQETGRSRKRNLNDWARVIERLRTGTQQVMVLPPPPERDSLDWRVLAALGDMQEKGIMMLEGELESTYAIDLEPEDVREACERLAVSGLARRTTPAGEDPFYEKVSPLGEDDLNH